MSHNYKPREVFIWLCSSETDDLCVSVVSRRALRMSSSAFSSPTSSDESCHAADVATYFLLRRKIVARQKGATFAQWMHQTWTAQEDAIEWFVTKFPPSIQEHVRTFLKTPSARYLAELEIQVHRPPLRQNLYRRTYFAPAIWKRYERCNETNTAADRKGTNAATRPIPLTMFSSPHTRPHPN